MKQYLILIGFLITIQSYENGLSVTRTAKVPLTLEETGYSYTLTMTDDRTGESASSEGCIKVNDIDGLDIVEFAKRFGK